MFMVTPKLCANEMFKYLVMLIVIFSSVDNAVSMRMKSRTVDDYSDKIHNSNRPLTLKECYRTRLKMDDENYRNVINWYKSCIKLGESKSGQQKDAYTMKLIQNLLRSSSEFFSQTKLLPETVARIEKECSSMVDRILYSSSMAPKKSSGTVTDDSNNSTCVKKTKTDDDLAVLLNHIRWAAFIALALILLILIVLLYFCLATFNQSNAQTCKCPCYCAAKNQRSPDKVSSLSNLTIISANQSKEQMQHIPSKPPIMRYKETKKWPNAGTDKCYVRKDYDDVLSTYEKHCTSRFKQPSI
ncbi:hypothetical protein O3M35_000926 [Rhynocoris fuscipes]|uniref:Uncharacterized protein n=1 Tax=Rhynocoris fuscipes TaxID=488301 RepID=A0AAW1DSI9_9HEMI